MGSKRRLLQNGLGEAIVANAASATRVVDLFSGAGFVSWYASQTTPLPVYAVDLQTYSYVLCSAVIGRTVALDADALTKEWVQAARESEEGQATASKVKQWEMSGRSYSTRVKYARALCSEHQGAGPIWPAYGGHYFSPRQALRLDLLLSHLPSHEPCRTACMAALISAASKCAAAPGHTAQPLQPTERGVAHIEAAWKADPFTQAEAHLHEIAPLHANVLGEARVADAVEVARTLTATDLVFVDPPYSGVHYSRFYHVLETIARGDRVEVSGIGRYPARELRPQSDFSKKTTALKAFTNLLDGLQAVGSTVIITFPSGESSNGLSGTVVQGLAEERFIVESSTVNGKFSTLGGNGIEKARAARQPSSELLLVLRPRK